MVLAMVLDTFHPVLLLLLAGVVAWAVRTQMRLSSLSVSLGNLRTQSERRARTLDLLARDMNAAGLSLLGRAQVLGDEAGVGFQAEARHILTLADTAAEAGEANGDARSLRDERFPLGPILREAVDTAQHHLGPGLRHWRLDASLGSLVLRADQRALRGALVQVLCRAARATNEGDFIDLRALRTPQGVTIVIEDEGVGLAVEDLSPAAQQGGAHHTRGLALGLSLARALLRAHGGELVMEAAPGIGARAFITLPADRVVVA
jgi:signal transduction histidine kinase